MRTRKVLLGCGIAASLLYVTMNTVAPLQYQGYSVLSQTVSELSAIGAPSRPLWVVLGFVYNVLMIAFGLSVWRSAGRNRALRVVGCLLAASGAIGFAWPPMHIRGEGFSLTDTLHIVVSAVWVLLSLSALGFGAAAFGRRFRIYSIASLLVQLALGTWVGMQGRNVAANLPTPWVGLVQRINIGVFMLWVVVLAIRMMRTEEGAASRRHLNAAERELAATYLRPS
jgi:hypothetical protein